MMRFYTLCIVWVLTLFLYGSPVRAISDDFTIGLTVGNDTTPPTIPAPVNATPITDSQIDIIWGASTDDQSLAGYKLFRNGVQIATTTLLTYSDTGLLASTTYTYTVQAYDWIMNVSTTSAAVSTTTLPAPSTSTSTSTSHTGGYVRVRLTDLQIDSSTHDVYIQWSTNTYAKYAFRWGKTSLYSLGFVQTEVFKKNHRTSIPDLEPGTTYQYQLVAYGRNGREYILSSDTFTTQAAADNTPSTNVSDFHAVAEGDSVRLSWHNPTDSDFSHVRIVRSYLFYPRDIADGFIVYEGDAESFFDMQALAIYSKQYYTIFAYDSYGNISSGAIAAVYRAKETETPSPVAGNTGVSSTPATHATGSVDSVDPIVLETDIPIDIGFLDVDVLQDGHIIPHIDGTVHVSDRLPIVFQIPSSRLPQHLKTIVVTIDPGTKNESSYLLRIHTQNDTYQAVTPALYRSGPHALVFDIYDYQTKQRKSFRGRLYVEKSTQAPTSGYAIWKQHTLFYISWVSLLFLLLILLLLRKRRREQEQTTI